MSTQARRAQYQHSREKTNKKVADNKSQVAAYEAKAREQYGDSAALLIDFVCDVGGFVTVWEVTRSVDGAAPHRARVEIPNEKRDSKDCRRQRSFERFQTLAKNALWEKLLLSDAPAQPPPPSAAEPPSAGVAESLWDHVRRALGLEEKRLCRKAGIVLDDPDDPDAAADAVPPTKRRKKAPRPRTHATIPKPAVYPDISDDVTKKYPFVISPFEGTNWVISTLQALIPIPNEAVAPENSDSLDAFFAGFPVPPVSDTSALPLSVPGFGFSS